MQYAMNQNKLMEIMVTKALQNVSPELLAKVEEEAKKRGMSDTDIAAGKEIISNLKKGA